MEVTVTPFDFRETLKQQNAHFSKLFRAAFCSRIMQCFTFSICCKISSITNIAFVTEANRFLILYSSSCHVRFVTQFYLKHAVYSWTYKSALWARLPFERVEWPSHLQVLEICSRWELFCILQILMYKFQRYLLTIFWLQNFQCRTLGGPHLPRTVFT